MSRLTIITILMIQVALAADLTDNDSFWGVFDNLTKYADNLLLIVFGCTGMIFLVKRSFGRYYRRIFIKRIGYPTRMDIMLQENGEWQGITDFDTLSIASEVRGSIGRRE